MTVRTTIEDVEYILDNTGLEDDVLESFIEGANVFVTANLADKSLNTTLLAEIERWIAAHMISVTRERTYSEAEAGGAKVKYTGRWGEGLKSTSYGLMAIELDTSDTLLKMTEGKKVASIRAVESFDD
jgi:hypothetical protein